MPLIDQRHTFRFPLPHQVVYDRATDIKVEAWLDGAAVTITSATVTVYDESNAVIVNAQAATIATHIATYSVAADTFASGDVSERLRMVWSIVISGTTYVAENDGLVVARELYPVITDDDLYRRVSALDASSATAITAQSNYQLYIDESFTELLGRMIEDGYRPAWTMSPSSLRRSHTLLCLSHIFEDMASRINIAYAERAEMYRQQAMEAYKAMTVLQDADGDGTTDRPGRRGVAHPSIWLGGR